MLEDTRSDNAGEVVGHDSVAQTQHGADLALGYGLCAIANRITGNNGKASKNQDLRAE